MVRIFHRRESAFAETICLKERKRSAHFRKHNNMKFSFKVDQSRR